MIGLIKSLVTIAFLFFVIGLAVTYLPPDTRTDLTSKAAGLAVKGCRGGKALYEAFRAEMEKQKAEEK